MRGLRQKIQELWVTLDEIWEQRLTLFSTQTQNNLMLCFSYVFKNTQTVHLQICVWKRKCTKIRSYDQ